MTIELNATLLVQAFNFLIAYLILRFLFFKPAVDSILKESRSEIDAHAHIEQLSKGVASAKQDHEKLWASCRRFFMEYKPTPLQSQDLIYRQLTPMLAVNDLSDTKKDGLVKEVTIQLVEKVGSIS